MRLAAFFLALLVFGPPLSAQTVSQGRGGSSAWSVGINQTGTNNDVEVTGAALTALQLIDDAVSGTGFNISQLGGAAIALTTTQADNLALTLDALNVAAFLYVHDGTNLDLLRVGPAGTAAATVLTVQGIAGMTAVQVAGSISCSNCSGSGASDVDDSSFTLGTDSVAPAGFLADQTTPDSVDEGDVGLARMLLNRIQLHAIWDALGNERGASVNASNQLAVLDGNSAAALTALQLLDNAAAEVANDYLVVRLTDGTSFLAADTQGTHATTLGTITSVTGAMLMGNASTATPTDVGADGDAALLWLTRNGALNIADGGGSITVDGSISCSNCSGSGASDVDDSSFTLGTDSVAPGGFLADQTTPDSVDEGDVGLARMLLNRIQLNAIWDATGQERGAAVNASNQLTVLDGNSAAALTALQLIDNLVLTEDTASAGGESGVQLLAVRDATPGNTSSAEGDFEPLQVNGGRLWVDPSGVTLTVASHAVTNAGTFAVQVDGAALTALQLLDDVVFTDDAAFTVASSKVSAAGFMLDDTSPDAIDEGDVGIARMSSDRILYQRPGGASVHYRTAAGTTEDEHEVKATAGTLYSVIVTNTNAAARYLRCYNLTAANTTPGTSTVFWGAAIPGSTTGAGFVYPFPAGLTFDTALTCAFTTGAADSDVAEVAANEIKATYTFR